MLARVVLSLGLLGLLGLAGYLTGERYRERDWLPWFQARRGELSVVAESAPEKHGRGLMRRIELADDRGLRLHVVVKSPAEPEGRLPAIITLGGARSSGRVLDYLGETGDLVILAADYPYDGKRSGLTATEFLRSAPAIHAAMLETVPALMLAVDYLHRRPDVDPERVVLVAGSFGALFAPAAVAADERISGLALLFGAADLPALVDAVLEVPEPLRTPAAWAGGTLVSPLEPLKYMGRVAPRPVLLINGTEDERLPEPCVRRLEEATGEPKTVRWMSLAHVTVRDEEFKRQVLEELLTWLDGIGAGPGNRGEAGAAGAPARPD